MSKDSRDDGLAKLADELQSWIDRNVFPIAPTWTEWLMIIAALRAAPERNMAVIPERRLVCTFGRRTTNADYTPPNMRKANRRKDTMEAPEPARGEGDGAMAISTVTVPVKPTSDMLRAGGAHGSFVIKDCEKIAAWVYAAMLAAAPERTAPPVVEPDPLMQMCPHNATGRPWPVPVGVCKKCDEPPSAGLGGVNRRVKQRREKREHMVPLAGMPARRMWNRRKPSNESPEPRSWTTKPMDKYSSAPTTDFGVPDYPKPAAITLPDEPSRDRIVLPDEPCRYECAQANDVYDAAGMEPSFGGEYVKFEDYDALHKTAEAAIERLDDAVADNLRNHKAKCDFMERMLVAESALAAANARIAGLQFSRAEAKAMCLMAIQTDRNGGGSVEIALSSEAIEVLYEVATETQK